MHLFLIRHGQSHANKRRDLVRTSAQMNAPLTDLGHTQAESMATWMKSKVTTLDALYSSTLLRARETAAQLERAYGMQAVLDDRVREGGYCYSSGKPIEDDLLPMNKHADYHRKPFTPFAAEPEGVESFFDMRQRVGSFLHMLLETHPGEVVAVVNHGWVVNTFMDLIFNVGSYRRCYLNNDYTAISYFEYVGDHPRGPWQVHFIAQTPHLEVFADGFAHLGQEA